MRHERRVKAPEGTEVSDEHALLAPSGEERAPELGDARRVRAIGDVGGDGHPCRLLVRRQRTRAEQREPVLPRGDGDVDAARRACGAERHHAVHDAGERAACRLAADVPADFVHVQLEAATRDPRAASARGAGSSSASRTRWAPTARARARPAGARAARGGGARSPQAEARRQHVHRDAGDLGGARGLRVVARRGGGTPHVHEVALCGERGDEMVRVLAPPPRAADTRR